MSNTTWRRTVRIAGAERLPGFHLIRVMRVVGGAPIARSADEVSDAMDERQITRPRLGDCRGDRSDYRRHCRDRRARGGRRVLEHIHRTEHQSASTARLLIPTTREPSPPGPHPHRRPGYRVTASRARWRGAGPRHIQDCGRRPPAQRGSDVADVLAPARGVASGDQARPRNAVHHGAVRSRRSGGGCAGGAAAAVFAQIFRNSASRNTDGRCPPLRQLGASASGCKLVPWAGVGPSPIEPDWLSRRSNWFLEDQVDAHLQRVIFIWISITKC